MWDLIASVPDHCLSFYFMNMITYSVVYRLFRFENNNNNNNKQTGSLELLHEREEERSKGMILLGQKCSYIFVMNTIRLLRN